MVRRKTMDIAIISYDRLRKMHNNYFTDTFVYNMNRKMILTVDIITDNKKKLNATKQ